MQRTWRSLLALAIALASIASTCDEDDDRVTGTYILNVFESSDTCDNQINEFASRATISQGATGGFVIDFEGQGTLTGDFSDEGVLVATGTIQDLGGGRTTVMQIGLVIRQGQITQGSGRLTFNGTYPGNIGLCVQEFGISGGRNDSRSPIIG